MNRTRISICRLALLAGLLLLAACGKDHDPDQYAIDPIDCPKYGVPLGDKPMPRPYRMQSGTLGWVQKQCNSQSMLVVGCTVPTATGTNIYVDFLACDEMKVHEMCHALTGRRKHTPGFDLKIMQGQDICYMGIDP